jgi:hypothetical protein
MAAYLEIWKEDARYTLFESVAEGNHIPRMK